MRSEGLGGSMLKGLAVAAVLCLLLAARPEVRQSASCFSASIRLQGGIGGGGGNGSGGSAPSGPGEAEYAFVDFVGENSTLETRSCGWIEGLRSSETSRHQHYPRQIVDVLPFSHELDLLTFRLMEYWDVVDRFVVIESAQAFSGLQKPLHFGDALCTRFAPFARKLVHVVIDPQLSGGVWEFETAHREAMVPVARLLGLSPDDLLLSGDTDEFPRSTAVRHAANSIWNALRAGSWSNSTSWPMVILDLQLYYFSLFHRVKIPWHHQCKIYPLALANLSGVNAMRHSTGSGVPHPSVQLLETIPKAGIHPSYCFEMEGIIAKVRSFSHYDAWADKNDTQVKEQMQQWIRENKSWEAMDGGLWEPRTNPDLFGYHPEVRDALATWTLELHRRQLED